jgi:hypothetical protein
MKPAKKIAIISFYSLLLFAVIVCLLHFLRPDKNMFTCFVSEYAVGNYGWLMTADFYTLAFATTFLFISLVQHVKASATGCIATGIFCVGIFLAGIFPTDLPVEPPTPRGLIHGLSALIALFCLGVSMIAWGNSFRRNGGLKSISKFSVFYGIVSLVMLVILVGSPVSLRGLMQRILLAWDIGWLLLVSWKLQHNAVGTTNLSHAK